VVFPEHEEMHQISGPLGVFDGALMSLYFGVSAVICQYAGWSMDHLSSVIDELMPEVGKRQRSDGSWVLRGLRYNEQTYIQNGPETVEVAIAVRKRIINKLSEQRVKAIDAADLQYMV
jgi:hypothetical protein